MSITTTQIKKSDRYSLKDFPKVTTKEYIALSPSHSLCINCSDYYDIPPCQNGLTSDSGCFPSLQSLDYN